MSAPAPWTARRWREVAHAVAHATPDWAAWARAELQRDAVGQELVTTHGWEPDDTEAAGAYDRQRIPEERTAAGQFFTPAAIADALVRLAGDAALTGAVLDPACGAGELLCAVFRARRAAGVDSAAALAGLTGWDLDPTAAWGARASLVLEALNEPAGAPGESLSLTGGVDALKQTAEADVVVMNPPYLEAKRMRRAQPGLREWLRDAFPKLHGAFDLYMAFLHRAASWVRPEGTVLAVLPNKVCQSRYAARFRTEGPLHLHALDDLSRMTPRPFPGTSVYPVLVALGTEAGDVVVGRHVATEHDLHSATAVSVRALSYAHFVESPWFVPFDTWPTLERLLSGPRLADIATVRSTCSFHRKGLREQYVVDEQPEAPCHRYIGGPSYTRTSEVGPYSLDWAGWYILDAAQALRDAGNPLPSFEGTFLRPKLVLRQHARRAEAWVDRDGVYVTKDVYPVAWPADRVALDVLAAIVNSTVFTALYNTVYQGIVVGGETYHYLPAFLRQVPVPLRATFDRIAEVATAEGATWLDIDRAVSDAYGVTESERLHMVATHLTRVGAPEPS